MMSDRRLREEVGLFGALWSGAAGCTVSSNKKTAAQPMEKTINWQAINIRLHELGTKSQIATVEMANVFHTIAHHYQTVEAKAKSKSTPFFGIDTAGAEHIRVH